MSSVSAEFKHAIMVNHIVGSILSQKALPKMWGIPSFLLTIPGMLAGQFGEAAFALYEQMTPEEQQAALSHYEASGGAAAAMMGAVPWEDAPNGEFSIDCVKFKENSAVVYAQVVEGFVGKAYSQMPQDMRQKMIEVFVEQPEELQKVIDDHGGRR